MLNDHCSSLRSDIQEVMPLGFAVSCRGGECSNPKLAGLYTNQPTGFYTNHPTNRLIYQPAYTLPGRPRQIPIPAKNPPKRRYIRVIFVSGSEYRPPVSLLCFLPDVRLSRKKTGFPKNAFSQRRRPAACGLMYSVHQSSQTLFSAASKS